MAAVNGAAKARLAGLFWSEGARQQRETTSVHCQPDCRAALCICRRSRPELLAKGPPHAQANDLLDGGGRDMPWERRERRPNCPLASAAGARPNRATQQQCGQRKVASKRSARGGGPFRLVVRGPSIGPHHRLDSAESATYRATPIPNPPPQPFSSTRQMATSGSIWRTIPELRQRTSWLSSDAELAKHAHLYSPDSCISSSDVADVVRGH